MPTGDIKMDDQQAMDELKEIFFTKPLLTVCVWLNS